MNACLQPWLAVRRLSIFSGESSSPLVHNINLEIWEGQCLTLVGETGSGKSLIAQALAGTLPSQFRVDGQDFLHKDFFFIPQQAALALNPTRKIQKQVQEIPQLVKKQGASAARLEMEWALEQVHLNPEQDGNRYPAQLSGGMQQRALLAMALLSPAPCILLDEPTKGLDEALRDQLAIQFKLLLKKGKTLLCITHDFELARQLQGQIVVLYQGKVVEQGASESVLNSPQHTYTQALLRSLPENGLQPVSSWKENLSENWEENPSAKILAKDKTKGKTKGKTKDKTKEDHLIQVEGLGHQLGGKQLYREFSCQIQRGEIVGLTGPSGCGKSTLGNLILGLIPPQQGEIYWEGKPLRKYNQRELREKRSSYQKLYQIPAQTFPPFQSLRQSFEEILTLSSISPRSLNWGWVLESLSRIRLPEDLLDRRPHEVSGGELQRLALLRTLLVRPRFLVADEPTSQLDPSVQALVARLIVEMAEQHHLSVLFISHDQKLLSHITDRCILLK